MLAARMDTKLSQILLVFIFIVNFSSCRLSTKSDDDVEIHLIAGSDKIEYKFWTQKWENIKLLLKNVTKNEIDQICAKGTWLLYSQSNLINDDIDTLDGVTLLTSDVEKCFKKDELGHDLESVQHVTSFRKRKADTIVFFEYENFIGRKMVVNAENKSPDDPPGYYTLVRSVITVGKQEWIVLFGEGPNRVCFKPPQDQTVPVCLLSNLIDGDKLVDSGVLEVYKSKTPCDSHNSTIIEMKECYENSAGIVHPKPLSSYRTPDGGDDGQDEGKVECEETNDILENEHVELIAGRLNGSLGSGDWFSAIKDTKNIWKAELFDACFLILTKICPNSVIDKEYLLVFASLYFYHLGKVWDSGKYLNVSISDLAWMEITHDMNVCVATINHDSFNSIAENTTSEMKSYKSLEDVTGKLETKLGFRSNNDHVMEINWLMANLVASICSKARGFNYNFLPRFLNIYHVLYFTPIEDQWTTPGNYSTIYKYLFGGFGMQKSLTKIALCTYNAMQFSGLTEPYKRPMEQTDRVLLPKLQISR